MTRTKHTPAKGLYIVQTRNPERFSWKEPDGVQTRFRCAFKAREMRDRLARSLNWSGLMIRVWDTSSDHVVEYENDEQGVVLNGKRYNAGTLLRSEQAALAKARGEG